MPEGELIGTQISNKLLREGKSKQIKTEVIFL